MKVDEFCDELVVAASDFIDAALDDHEGPTVSKEFSQSRQKLVSLITQWVRGDVARTLNTTTTDCDEGSANPK